MTIDLGRFGIWQPAFLTSPEMAVAIETLGFPTLWVAGPQTDLAGIDDLLAATRSLVVATSILNVWHGDPATAAAAYHRISDRFPDRFWLGLGMGHREQNREYSKPLTRLSEYLDGLDAGGVPIEGRSLAALGPKALALSAERCGGAVTYLVTPRHTELARGALGPDRVLAPEHKVVLEPNPERARARARPRIKQYLGLVNYTNNLRRLGFSDEDLSGEGSDRLIDALVAHGDPDTIARHLGAHIKAGADHVAIQVLGTEHRPHPSRPDVLIQVYGDEVFEAYESLADELLKTRTEPPPREAARSSSMGHDHLRPSRLGPVQHPPSSPAIGTALKSLHLRGSGEPVAARSRASAESTRKQRPHKRTDRDTTGAAMNATNTNRTLDHPVGIVAGATSGIGAGTATLLAQRRASVSTP